MKDINFQGGTVKIIDECRLVDTKQGFYEVIAAQKVVLAMVYATWCPFCLHFLPVFKKFAHSNPNFLLVRDEMEKVADAYDVNVIPTVLCFENGKVSKRLDGTLGVGLSENQLVAFIRECGLEK